MRHSVIVFVPKSPLIFVHQFVHADYNSQKWKSGIVYYIILKIKNGGGLGKKKLMAIGILVALILLLLLSAFTLQLFEIN